LKTSVNGHLRISRGKAMTQSMAELITMIDAEMRRRGMER
jgi:hypothetical protein